jgi:hypothetical protein
MTEERLLMKLEEAAVAVGTRDTGRGDGQGL